MREFSLNVSILLSVMVPKINYLQKEKAKMQKISRVILIVCLFLSASIAQQSYGLGFEFHTFPSAFMEEGGGLGIYLPINSGSLLIEPLIMYSSSSTEVDYDDYSQDDYETSESDFTLLVGIFKPTNSGKIRSYYGIRIGKSWSKYEISTPGSDDVESDYLVIAPTAGAEYYISDNFSFGGEAMYFMATREEEDEGYYSTGTGKTTTYKDNVLIPRFIVRFYF